MARSGLFQSMVRSDLASYKLYRLYRKWATSESTTNPCAKPVGIHNVRLLSSDSSRSLSEIAEGGWLFGYRIRSMLTKQNAEQQLLSMAHTQEPIVITVAAFFGLRTLRARSLTGTAQEGCGSGRPASTRREHCPAHATKIAGPAPLLRGALLNSRPAHWCRSLHCD